MPGSACVLEIQQTSAKQSRVEPFYWSLWAQIQRKALANNGYPSKVTFYDHIEPPRAGDIYDPPTHLTSDDYAKVAAIESAVSRHRKTHPTEVKSLEIWEGAYTAASASRKERVDEWCVDYDACRIGAKRAKKAVERYMYGA